MDYPRDFAKHQSATGDAPDPIISYAQQRMAALGYRVREIEDGIVNTAMLDQAEVFRSHHGLRLVRVIDAELLDALSEDKNAFPEAVPAEPSVRERMDTLETALIAKKVVTEAELKQARRARSK